jgi:hypothetical protein
MWIAGRTPRVGGWIVIFPIYDLRTATCDELTYHQDIAAVKDAAQSQ